MGLPRVLFARVSAVREGELREVGFLVYAASCVV